LGIAHSPSLRHIARNANRIIRRGVYQS
jgi:hypothetical protein